MNTMASFRMLCCSPVKRGVVDKAPRGCRLKKAARCEAAQLPIQGGMPDERATVTRERYRNANDIAGCIRPLADTHRHGARH
jgi:hypothetical protein